MIFSLSVTDFTEETLGVYALTVTPTAGDGGPLTFPDIRVTDRGMYGTYYIMDTAT